MNQSEIQAMADKFHPSAHGGSWHINGVLDAVEAALLWAAGAITEKDFHAVVDEMVAAWEEKVES